MCAITSSLIGTTMDEGVPVNQRFDWWMSICDVLGGISCNRRVLPREGRRVRGIYLRAEIMPAVEIRLDFNFDGIL